MLVKIASVLQEVFGKWLKHGVRHAHSVGGVVVHGVRAVLSVGLHLPHHFVRGTPQQTAGGATAQRAKAAR